MAVEWCDLPDVCNRCGGIHRSDDECQDTGDEARERRIAHLESLAEDRATDAAWERDHD